MENLNQELKELSNISDEWVNPIIEEYFKGLNFENILCDSEDEILENSEYFEVISNDICPYLKKFEPISLSFLESKIFDVVCQELSIGIVNKDSCYGFFDDVHLIEGKEEFGPQIFNLFQKICSVKITEYSFEVNFKVESGRLYKENFRVTVESGDEFDETDVLYKIQSSLYDIKDELETRLKQTLKSAATYDDWKVLFASYGDFFFEEEDEFKTHLKRLELI